jgi:hypothetical protein
MMLAYDFLTYNDKDAESLQAALQSHYGWLKSFRSEMSKTDGPATPRYLLNRSATMKPGAGMGLPVSSTGNDITIRIKVEK